MTSLNEKEWQLATQALLDGEGYPKSEEQKIGLKFSTSEIRQLLDGLLKVHNKDIDNTEKQILLNCIDGALDYVGTDIPSLYSISESQLREFKEDLEKKWSILSTYSK